MLDRLLDSRRVLIVVGAGGVGKTTLSAALGVRAALRGRKVAVLTVDPARRLATSLGLTAFTDEARRVSIPRPDGGHSELDAMMLDTRSILTRLVRRYATGPEQADAILNNPFFNQFSGAVGGTHEYTAMERLYELREQGAWDLLILDTPPSIHALDLLGAPQRLMDAFDESILRWVVKPYVAAGKVGVQMLSFGSAYIFKTLASLSGAEMIQNLSEFLSLFHGMFQGFRERARAVDEMLRHPETDFLLVTAPQTNALAESATFIRELGDQNLRLGGILLNRCVPALAQQPDEARLRACIATQEARPGSGLDDAFTARLLAVLAQRQAAHAHQEALLGRFFEEWSPDAPCFRVPLQTTDVSDITGLVGIADALAYT